MKIHIPGQIKEFDLPEQADEAFRYRIGTALDDYLNSLLRPDLTPEELEDWVCKD